jgi:uncharacterized membrane protein
MKPQHFDILGSLAFAYVSIFAINMLVNKGGVVPDWSIYLLTLIGVVGFLVDITIVFVYFIKKK